MRKHDKLMQNDAFQYDAPMKLPRPKNNCILCNVEQTHLLNSPQFHYYNTLYELHPTW